MRRSIRCDLPCPFHGALQSRQILPSQPFGEEQCSGKNKFHVSSSPKGRDFTRKHRERQATKEERKIHLLRSPDSVWLKQEIIIKPVIGYPKCNTARKKKMGK